MSIGLCDLIQLARKYTMTTDERNYQIRRFAYGNAHFENEVIAKTEIDEEMDILGKDREPHTVRS